MSTGTDRPAGGDADRRGDRTAALLVVTLALCAFATALCGTFVYDDVHTIAANPGVQTLANVPRFFVDATLFSNGSGVMYRPVLLATFALDWTVGHGSPLPFKLTNVALHALTAALLFLLLRRHALPRAAACVAAAWFAVHPLAAETVNMVSARSEGLFACGLVVALLAHRRLLDGDTRSPRGAAALVLLGALVAAGSKETGVLVGPLLLVQEWLCGGVPRRREAWLALLRRVGPVLAVAAVYLVVRRLLLGEATATLVGRAGGDPMYGHTRDVATQLATMGPLLPKVVAQALLPTGLGLDPKVVYHESFADPAVLGGWGSVLFATALGLRRGRRQPLVVLGLALAWATALPWIVVPLNLPLAEHRCYGPLLGFACLLGALCERLLRRLPLHVPATARRVRTAAGAALVLLAGTAAWQSLRYRDEGLLWQHALAHNPTSFRAWWGLGTVAMRRGDLDAAEPLLARSCALYPAFRTARRTWVECLLWMPRERELAMRALVVAAELARQKDDDPYYRLLHANALLAAGIEQDRADLLEAGERTALGCLELGPPKATVFRVAAECRRRLGDAAGALAHLDAALDKGLDFPALRADRSELLRALGRDAEADRDLRGAFRQAPFEPAVRAAWERQHAAAAAPR